MNAGRARAWFGIAALIVLPLTACGSSPARESVPDGDPGRGRAAILQNGCTSCHSIPGVPSVDGERVAPDLAGLEERYHIAGHIANEQEELIAWLLDPQSIEPGTIMPDVGLTEQEARDIAAYLLSR